MCSVGQCVSSLSQYCDKCLAKAVQGREGGRGEGGRIDFGSLLEGTFKKVWRTWWQEFEASGHIISKVRKLMKVNTIAQLMYLSLDAVWNCSPGNVAIRVQCVSSHQLNFAGNTIMDTHSFVSKVTQVTLTVKISHHVRAEECDKTFFQNSLPVFVSPRSTHQHAGTYTFSSTISDF